MRLSILLAALLASQALAQPAAQIRRLDGSKISIADADAFARKTLADAHVTGAQIAVLNNGLQGLEMDDAHFMLIKGIAILAALTLRVLAIWYFSQRRAVLA